MKKITYILTLVLVSCLAFMSCQDHNDDFAPAAKDGAIRVAFSTPDFVQVSTRATSESNIKDITVFQFKEGKLVAQLFMEDKLFSSAVELEGLESMPAATIDEESGALIRNGSENVLVFLTNVKAMTGTQISGFAIGTSTYADLLSYTATLADADALGNLQYLPMTGTYLNGIVDGVTNQINVVLMQVMAKINFTLNTANFTLPSGEVPGITVNSISLHNVPTTVAFFPTNRPALPSNGLPGEWPDNQSPYPAATAGSNTAAKDGGIDADNFVTLTASYNQAANKSTSFVGYMPENARGSYTNITNNKQKIPANIPDAANRVGLTYLLVDLDYATSDGIIKNATYKIYLGGDAAGDMNLLAHTQYNVTTYIYGDGSGASDVDTRITVSNKFNPSVTNPGSNAIQDLANSYIINPATVKPNFTIPLTQARNGWRYIHTSLRADGDATDYTAAFDNMIAGNWSIETLWKTWQGSNVVGTVATGITTASGAATNRYYATLTIPSDIPVGNNCVVALKDAGGNIWWTWHLWITDYDPDNTTTKNGQTHTYISNAFSAQGLYNGKKVMDRNLGATITGITDNYTPAQPTTTAEAVKWYGLMYQWGRKDPFTNSESGAVAMTGAVKIYDSSNTQITTENDGFPKVDNSSLANVLKEAVQNPMNFYCSGSNWTRQDNNLWNISSKTVFDPCPVGWRIPAGGTTVENNPWAGFSDGNAGSVASANPYNAANAGNIFDWYASNASGNSITGSAGRLYDKNGTKAWYPTSGLRHNMTGAFTDTGATGYYWSSALAGSSSYNLRLLTNTVDLASSNIRARGSSIRCIQQ